MHLVLQTSGSQEVRALLQHSLLKDIPTTRCGLSNLVAHAALLKKDAIPIGSVEFVREAMRLLNMKEPGSISYPDVLRPWLYRTLDCVPRYDMPTTGVWFIKPASRAKLFNGFVHGASASEGAAADHDKEQLDILLQLPAQTPIFVSSVVSFISEWRYYVLQDAIAGRARYDQEGADDAPEPDQHQVSAMVSAMAKSKGRPRAYSLDVGVLDTGETALVEVNDAWALGLYRDMENTESYLQMLSIRWEQMKKQ